MTTKNKIISNIAYIISLVGKYNGRVTLFCVIKNIIEKMFYSFFFVYFIEVIYDLIGGGHEFKNVSYFLIAVCCGQIFVYCIVTGYDLYEQKKKPIILEAIYLHIFKKAIKIPLEKAENPDFYNKYTRALDNAQNSIIKIISLVGNVSGQFARLFMLIAITVLIDPALLIFPFVSLINSVLVALIKGKVEYKQKMELSEYERKCDYCKRIFYEKKYAQELRQYNIKSRIDNMYTEAVEKIKKIRKGYTLELTLIEIWDKTVMKICLLVLACIYLSYNTVVQGRLSVGEFAGAMAAISNISYCVGYLTFYIGELFKYGVDSSNLIEFLEYNYEKFNNKELCCIKPLESLTVKNLTYRYEGMDLPALNKLNFSIKRGEKIAIVGYNGAGKSTLVNVLLGLYKGYDGKVLWNQCPIEKIHHDEYSKHISSVLQDFSIYEVSVAENVAMNDTVEDNEEIWNALKNAGISKKILKLENGIETNVSKEFDKAGVVLSGGELQKLALARVFFAKEAELIILDEPTSAMDPLSEYNIYQSLFSNLKNKTIIFISHRLLTCTMADRIFMMENGQIVEQGTHEELMNFAGKYAEMFKIQSSKINGDTYKI